MKTVGIISLGLIGGSILKALKGKYNLVGITQNDETLKSAKEYASVVSKDMNELKECDFIFVASPMFCTNEILDQLKTIIKPECIVMDCCSVKGFINKQPYKFIGTHPMAGKETCGFDASYGELFDGCKWVFCPQDNVSDEEINSAMEIVKLMKAEVIITTPHEHDAATALISHMPLFLSQALLFTAKDNPLALKLASSGFRDMTRICMSNLGMAKDMREYNAENISFAIDKLLDSIEYLKQNNNRQELENLKSLRQIMYSPDGKNIM